MNQWNTPLANLPKSCFKVEVSISPIIHRLSKCGFQIPNNFPIFINKDVWKLLVLEETFALAFTLLD